VSLKKWLAFGSGVGIQIAGPKGAESLHISAVRVRPTGVTVRGGFTIEDYPHWPAAEWGADYAAFSKKLQLRGVPAVALLPRHEVIVRPLALPGVSDKDLDNAVRFQLEGLHPYNEDDVYFSWARLGRTSTVLVAIARKEAVDRYAALFEEAGIKVGRFTCSAAAIYSALRLYGAASGTAPSGELLAWDSIDSRPQTDSRPETDSRPQTDAGSETELRPETEPRPPGSGTEGLELYGESAAKPAFSANFDLEPTRARALAVAEMRADPALELKPLAELLGANPPLPYAAALLSACPRRALPLNLLPPERREFTSRLRWALPSALALLVLLIAAGFAALPRYERRQYQAVLEAQIAQINQQAARSAQLDKQIETVRRRTEFLDNFRRQSKSNIDALGELTRILPPPTWLNLTEISPRQILISGETDQAEPLLKTLDGSPLFEGSEFQGAPVRTLTSWVFRIRTNRKGAGP
jgi:Tfp pilus assembly protein PilN